MKSSNPTTNTRHLVAIPFPGRGHIHPMLALCDRLVARGPCLTITTIVTEEWLGLLSGSLPPLNKHIRFLTIPNVVPSETTRGASYEAFIVAVLTKMAAAVDVVIGELDVPADAILADATLPWAPQIGERRGVPVSALFPQSATMFLAVQHLSSREENCQCLRNLNSGSNERSKWLDYLPRPSSAYLSISIGQETTKFFTEAISWSTTSHALLFTSPLGLERRAIATLKSTLSLPIYTIGPSVLTATATTTSSYPDNWLDAQPPSSVLYVSLGSFLPISPPQMDEIATGLRISGVRFLLVARQDAARMQELGGDLGLVVPWADQMRALSHPSVGGFLTHCGWNSTMEGACAGLPMLTFPLMWDQFPNSKLVVDEWKVGSRLKDGDEFVRREEIAKGVSEFMDVESREGMEMRRRARELKETCGLALEEKGSSLDCIDAFVHGIVRRDQGTMQI